MTPVKRKIKMRHGNPDAQHMVSTRAGIIWFTNGGIATPNKEQREALDEIGFEYDEVETPDRDLGEPWNTDAQRDQQALIQVPALNPNRKAVEAYTQAERARAGLPNTVANSVNPAPEPEEAPPEEETAPAKSTTEATAPRYAQRRASGSTKAKTGKGKTPKPS